MRSSDGSSDVCSSDLLVSPSFNSVQSMPARRPTQMTARSKEALGRRKIALFLPAAFLQNTLHERFFRPAESRQQSTRPIDPDRGCARTGKMAGKPAGAGERKSVVEGRRVSVRVAMGGGR